MMYGDTAQYEEINFGGKCFGENHFWQIKIRKTIDEFK